MTAPRDFVAGGTMERGDRTATLLGIAETVHITERPGIGRAGG